MIVRSLAITLIGVASYAWMTSLRRATADADRWQFVIRIVVAVGLLSAMATPMLTRDLNCYAGFGRLAAHGINPYVTKYPEALQAEFNSNNCGGTTTYGPVWTYGTALLDRLTAPLGVRTEILAVRIVIVGAWIAMVAGIARLVRSRDFATRAAVLAAAAVVPASAFELVGEAHNDVVMMALVVGWLVLRANGSWLSPIPLVLSVLVKYVSAPLLLFAAIDALRRRRYLEAGVALTCGTLILTAAGLLWTNGAFASLTANNANWRWLSAPFFIELTVKNVAPFAWVAPLVWLWRGAMLVGFGWFAYRWMAERESDSRFHAVIAAGMLALLFSADYLWPWYFVWALPFVILADHRLISAIAWPFFIVLPVAHAAYAGGRPEGGYRPEVIVLMLGLIACAWLWQGWRWFAQQRTAN